MIGDQRLGKDKTVAGVLAERYTLTAAGCAATGGHTWTLGSTPGVKVCKACGTCEASL